MVLPFGPVDSKSIDRSIDGKSADSNFIDSGGIMVVGETGLAPAKPG